MGLFSGETRSKMQVLFALALIGCATALPLQQVEYPASPIDNLVANSKPQYLVRYSAEDDDDDKASGFIRSAVAVDDTIIPQAVNSIETVDVDDVGYLRSAGIGNTVVVPDSAEDVIEGNYLRSAGVGNNGAVIGNNVVVPDSAEDIIEDNYFRSAVVGNGKVIVHDVDSVEDDAVDQYFRSAVGVTVPQETVIDVSQVDFANFRSAGYEESIIVPSNSGEDVEKYVLVGVAPSNSVTLGSRAATVYSASSSTAPIPIYQEVDDDDTSLENNVALSRIYGTMKSSAGQQMKMKAEPTMVGNNMVLLLD